MQVKGRTFIISGGSSGLGLATASNVISNGGYAAVLDVNPPPSELEKQKSQYYKTDVSSSQSIQDSLKEVLEWTKSTSAPLGGIICCAGISRPALALPKQADAKPTVESAKYYDMKAFDQVMAINLRGTVDLIRLGLPHLAANKPEGDDGERGVVVVVASVAAYEGQVGQLSYSASKGAIASIVLPLARELGPKVGVRVMGVAPGLFETGMTKLPKPRPGKPGEGAKPKGGTGEQAATNREMALYPARMGQGPEFARLVKEIVENPMLNGFVIRLDGGVRMPSRL